MLLNRVEFPSWLYPVVHGATTIWERWDGIKPDSTFQTPSMNSFNHYAYGAIGNWMYSVMAGLSETAPGFRQFRIAPQPGGDLTTASVSYKSPYGTIASTWTKDAGRFVLDVTIPPNTEAEIVLPKASGTQVTEHGKDVFNSGGRIIAPVKEGQNVRCTVGSGRYTFVYDWK